MPEKTFYLIDVFRPTINILTKRSDEDLSGLQKELA